MRTPQHAGPLTVWRHSQESIERETCQCGHCGSIIHRFASGLMASSCTTFEGRGEVRSVQLLLTLVGCNYRVRSNKISFSLCHSQLLPQKTKWLGTNDTLDYTVDAHRHDSPNVWLPPLAPLIQTLTALHDNAWWQCMPIRV